MRPQFDSTMSKNQLENMLGGGAPRALPKTQKHDSYVRKNTILQQRPSYVKQGAYSGAQNHYGECDKPEVDIPLDAPNCEISLMTIAAPDSLQEPDVNLLNLPERPGAPIRLNGESIMRLKHPTPYLEKEPLVDDPEEQWALKDKIWHLQMDCTRKSTLLFRRWAELNGRDLFDVLPTSESKSQ